MADKVLSAKVDEDSELWAEFQEFSEEYRTKSAAVRAALRRGLDLEDDHHGARAGGSGGGFAPLQRLLNSASNAVWRGFLAAVLAVGVLALAPVETWAVVPAVVSLAYIVLFVHRLGRLRAYFLRRGYTHRQMLSIGLRGNLEASASDSPDGAAEVPQREQGSGG